MGYYGLGGVALLHARGARKEETPVPLAKANETLRLFVSEIAERIYAFRRFNISEANTIIIAFFDRWVLAEDPIEDLTLIDLQELAELTAFLDSTREKLVLEITSNSPQTVFLTLAENFDSSAEYINSILTTLSASATALLRLDDYASDNLKRKDAPDILFENGDAVMADHLPYRPLFVSQRPPEPFGFNLSALVGGHPVNGHTFSESQAPAKKSEKEKPRSAHELFAIIADTIERYCFREHKSNSISDVFLSAKEEKTPDAIYRSLKRFSFIDGIDDFVEFLKSNEGVSLSAVSSEIIEQVSKHLIVLLESALEHEGTRQSLESVLYPEGTELPDFNAPDVAESALTPLDTVFDLDTEEMALPTFSLDDLAHDIEGEVEADSHFEAYHAEEFIHTVIHRVMAQLPLELKAAHETLRAILSDKPLFESIARAGFSELSLFHDYLADAIARSLPITEVAAEENRIVANMTAFLEKEFSPENQATLQVLEPLPEDETLFQLPDHSIFDSAAQHDITSTLEAFDSAKEPVSDDASPLPELSLDELAFDLNNEHAPESGEASEMMADLPEFSLQDLDEQGVSESPELLIDDRSDGVVSEIETDEWQALPSLSEPEEALVEGLDHPLQSPLNDALTQETTLGTENEDQVLEALPDLMFIDETDPQIDPEEGIAMTDGEPLIAEHELIGGDDLVHSAEMTEGVSAEEVHQFISTALHRASSLLPKTAIGTKVSMALNEFSRRPNLPHSLSGEPYRGIQRLNTLLSTESRHAKTVTDIHADIQRCVAILSGELLAYFAADERAEKETDNDGFSIHDFIDDPEDNTHSELTLAGEIGDDNKHETSPVGEMGVGQMENNVSAVDEDDDGSGFTASTPLVQSPSVKDEVSQEAGAMLLEDESFLIDDTLLSLEQPESDASIEKTKDTFRSLLSKAKESDPLTDLSHNEADLILPEDDVFLLEGHSGSEWIENGGTETTIESSFDESDSSFQIQEPHLEPLPDSGLSSFEDEFSQTSKADAQHEEPSEFSALLKDDHIGHELLEHDTTASTLDQGNAELLSDLPLLETEGRGLETENSEFTFSETSFLDDAILLEEAGDMQLPQESLESRQKKELGTLSASVQSQNPLDGLDNTMSSADLDLNFDENFLLSDETALANALLEESALEENIIQQPNEGMTPLSSGESEEPSLLDDDTFSMTESDKVTTDLNFSLLQEDLPLTGEFENDDALPEEIPGDTAALEATLAELEFSDLNDALGAEEVIESNGFVLDEIQQIFLDEAKEYFEKLDEDLLELDKLTDTVQTDLVHRIMRCSHTLKGSAAMVGLKNIATLGHKMEDCLQTVRDGNLPVQRVLVDALLRSTDILKAMVERFRKTGKDEHREKDAIAQQLQEFTLSLQQKGKIVVVEAAPEKKFEPDEIQQIFLDEAKEYLEKLGNDLVELDKLVGTEQPELVNRVLRSSHTLKGSAAMVGLKNISELGHHLEDCLQVMRDNNLKVSREVIDLLLPSSDMIAEMLADFRRSGSDAGGKQAPFSKALAAYTEQLKATGSITAPIAVADLKKASTQSAPNTLADAAADTAAQKRAAIAAEQTVRIDIKSLNSLVNLSAELVISRNRLNNELHTLQRFINRVLKDRAQLAQVAKKVNTLIQKSSENKELEKLQAFSSDVLKEFSDTEFDRFSDMDIVNRDLKSTMLNFDDSVSELRDITTTFNQNIAKVTALANDFNREVVTMRMVPVKQMFTRFNRSVRDIARNEGKELNFETEGEETKLDKNVMEEVIEPVMHIVRNAIGHGIESPEVRVSNGKDPAGNLSMKAYQKGSRFILEIEDDGGGIVVSKVKAKALKQGIISHEEAENMSPAEASALIFKPGFSTADKITELQGRGVGLDVVANTIRKLKGSVHVDSVEGRGTKFLISLPLTLAIGQALLVSAMNLIYAIPLEMVTETAYILTEEIEPEDEDGKRYITLRGERIELRYLNKILGDNSDAMQFKAKVAVVFLEIDEVGKFAIAVEKLLNKEEIVVKSLGKHLRNVKGVIGSTILGDGQVVVILDMEYLLKSEAARADVGVSVETAPTDADTAIAEVVRRKRKGERILVLHADDSPSVRKYASSVLTQAGIDVVSCDDGLNALTRLPKTPADIVITDLEMPRMNGFELVSEIRKLPEYKDLPIIIVTARAGDKHRRTGLELGANAFLNKPFDPQQLIETIENYVV